MTQVKERERIRPLNETSSVVSLPKVHQKFNTKAYSVPQVDEQDRINYLNYDLKSK